MSTRPPAAHETRCQLKRAALQAAAPRSSEESARPSSPRLGRASHMSFARALELHEAGDTDGAEMAYRSVVAAGGGRNGEHLAAAHSNLGALLGRTGNKVACEIHSAKAAAIAPDNAPVLYNWANALMEVERLSLIHI